MNNETLDFRLYEELFPGVNRPDLLFGPNGFRVSYTFHHSDPSYPTITLNGSTPRDVVEKVRLREVPFVVPQTVLMRRPTVATKTEIASRQVTASIWFPNRLDLSPVDRITDEAGDWQITSFTWYAFGTEVRVKRELDGHS